MIKKIVCTVGVSALLGTNVSAVWINEIHYDNAGGDTGEFVEIAGEAGTDVTGWGILMYNGGNGAVYKTETLAGIIDDEGDGYGALSFLISGIQNGGPDGIALVDASDVVLGFLSYEGSFTAASGAANGITSVDVGVSESSSTAIGESLQLVGDFAGGFSWAGPAADSPGSLNIGQTFPREEPPKLPEKPATVPDSGATAALLFGGITALSLLHRRNKMP